MTFIRDAWYVAAWDAEVDSSPLARTICGLPMMFYRTLDRSVERMRDACPHSMLPLSMGIREGDSIRCKYHGLKIGRDGFAGEMPLKHDAVPQRPFVETFSVAEKHRFVWVWLGDREKADLARIPNLWPGSEHAGVRARKKVARRICNGGEVR